MAAGAEKPEMPPQSDRGKCALRITDESRLYCEKQECKGDCVLYSLPRGNPDAEPRTEDQPCTPEDGRYYFCKCMPGIEL